MGGPFHHRHPDALFSQVLSHLKANESGSDDSARYRFMFLYKIIYCIGIRYVPQGKYMILPYPGNARLDRSCSRRKYKFVIAFLIGFFPMPYNHALFLRVHGYHLAVHTHIHVKTCMETLRGLKLQGILVRNHAADIIGQTAVGIGNI